MTTRADATRLIKQSALGIKVLGFWGKVRVLGEKYGFLPPMTTTNGASRDAQLLASPAV
jgi:hypothetical protein